MKNIVLILFLCPLFIFAQDNFNLPLNKEGTDIVYKQDFAIDSPQLHFNKILGLVNKLIVKNSFRNIVIDTNDLVVLANGTREFYDINSMKYKFELDYVIAIDVKSGWLQISNIYHKHSDEDKPSFGHCFDFKDKTHKAKYFDVINNMQVFMPMKVDEIKNQIDSTILGLMPEETIMKKKEYKSIPITENLTKDDYIIKASEAMNNFYKQKRAAHYVGFVGGGFMFLSFALANSQQSSKASVPISYMGGALIAVSAIINIDSYKYIKESSMYLKKSVDGIGIGFKF